MGNSSRVVYTVLEVTEIPDLPLFSTDRYEKMSRIRFVRRA
jgi:hypothetical protein